MTPDDRWRLFETQYLPTLEHRARTLAEQTGVDHLVLYDQTRDVLARRWADLDGEPPFGPALNFAMTVLRSKLRDRLRCRREEPVEDVGRHCRTPARDADPEAALIRKEEANRIYQLISALPERERTVFILRTTMQMQTTEIAAELGLSSSHVSGIYGRAVSRLRTWAGAEGLL